MYSDAQFCGKPRQKEVACKQTGDMRSRANWGGITSHFSVRTCWEWTLGQWLIYTSKQAWICAAPKPR
jgi:hypothetical protein